MLESLELDRQLRLGLEAMGYESPTEVQRAVIPRALNGVDLKVSAETGSGKTLAYLLPMAQSLLASPIPQGAGTLGLVLVPTRELARQVLKQCRDLLDKSPLRAQAITGGADFKYQKSVLRSNPEVLIATPGRLLEHCEKGGADLASIRMMVLDEADRMLDMGFRDDVIKIATYTPPERQVLLLSATLKHRGLGTVTRDLLNAPETITIGQVRQPHSRVHHQRILSDGRTHKEQLLTNLLQHESYERALVFTNKRTTAEQLARLLSTKQLRCACLHGEMSTEDRKRVMAQFRDGKVDVLCASDVAARGLDISNIDLVINFDLPRSGDDYLHRTGRTGRAGASGNAVSLVEASEWNLMISIQRYLKLELEPRVLKGLKARYSGPKKTKSSGKAVGKKKTKSTAKEAKRTRSGDRKARGGQSRGNKQGQTPVNDGFAPLTKKPEA